MGYQEQVFFVTGCVVFGLAGVACAVAAVVLVWGACVDAVHARRRQAKFKAFCKPRY